MMTEKEICRAIEAEGVFCNVRATKSGFTGARLVNRLIAGKLVPASDRRRVLILTHDAARLMY